MFRDEWYKCFIVYCIKAGDRQKYQLLAWWLSRVQLEEHRTADVTMALEGISSDRGTPKEGKMSGVGEGGAPQWVLKDVMQRRAKGLWVAVTWT